MFKFLPKTEKAHRHADDIDLTQGRPRFTKDAPVKDTSTTEELNRIAAMASECFEHVAFKKYRDSLVKIEEAVIGELMAEATQFEYGDKSVAQFGACVLAKLLKLITIKSLLLAVKKDILRGSSVSDEEKGK